MPSEKFVITDIVGALIANDPAGRKKKFYNRFSSCYILPLQGFSKLTFRSHTSYNCEDCFLWEWKPNRGWHTQSPLFLLPWERGYAPQGASTLCIPLRDVWEKPRDRG